MTSMFLREPLLAIFAVAAAVSLFTSNSASSETVMYWFYQGYTSFEECSVVEGEPKPGAKVVGGPFATRAEALRAMQQSPECQTKK